MEQPKLRKRYDVWQLVKDRKGKWRWKFQYKALLTTQRMIEVSMRADYRLKEIPLS